MALKNLVLEELKSALYLSYHFKTVNTVLLFVKTNITKKRCKCKVTLSINDIEKVKHHKRHRRGLWPPHAVECALRYELYDRYGLKNKSNGNRQAFKQKCPIQH